MSTEVQERDHVAEPVRVKLEVHCFPVDRLAWHVPNVSDLPDRCGDRVLDWTELKAQPRPFPSSGSWLQLCCKPVMHQGRRYAQIPETGPLRFEPVPRNDPPSLMPGFGTLLVWFRAAQCESISLERHFGLKDSPGRVLAASPTDVWAIVGLFDVFRLTRRGLLPEARFPWASVSGWSNSGKLIPESEFFEYRGVGLSPWEEGDRTGPDDDDF